MKIIWGYVVWCMSYIDVYVLMCVVMLENGGLVVFGENFCFFLVFFVDLLVEWKKLMSRIFLDKIFF